MTKEETIAFIGKHSVWNMNSKTMWKLGVTMGQKQFAPDAVGTMFVVFSDRTAVWHKDVPENIQFDLFCAGAKGESQRGYYDEHINGKYEQGSMEVDEILGPQTRQQEWREMRGLPPDDE